MAGLDVQMLEEQFISKYWRISILVLEEQYVTGCQPASSEPVEGVNYNGCPGLGVCGVTWRKKQAHSLLGYLGFSPRRPAESYIEPGT